MPQDIAEKRNSCEDGGDRMRAGNSEQIAARRPEKVLLNIFGTHAEMVKRLISMMVIVLLNFKGSCRRVRYIGKCPPMIWGIVLVSARSCRPVWAAKRL